LISGGARDLLLWRRQDLPRLFRKSFESRPLYDEFSACRGKSERSLAKKKPQLMAAALE
jgi:hypothetical protein